MAAKLKLFEEILGWSEAEVAKVVRMNPTVLRISGEKLRRVKEFLTKVVGVDTRYILTRPSILMYSLECRLVPRHYVMKVLQEKGLIQKDQSFYPMALPMPTQLLAKGNCQLKLRYEGSCFTTWVRVRYRSCINLNLFHGQPFPSVNQEFVS
ncbi:unnamed protein product [Triticum turgidum subsp. durum]|uniref:Uncharacterized protein n=1 Tax=Triticum turgidum subsp. durum TaxID=4567 RepID=A0A9R1B2Q6_TRITD|nr:unnamed protein product [Triticum turgidum subsp. durum]